MDLTFTHRPQCSDRQDFAEGLRNSNLCRARPDFLVETTGQTGFSLLQVVAGLQVQPELRFHREVAPKSKRRIRGDCSLALHDFADPSPAIRDYYSADRKISLYVFGDEFANGSIDEVVKYVDSIAYRKFNRPLSALSRGIERRVRENGRLLKDRSAVGGGCFARNCASPFAQESD